MNAEENQALIEHAKTWIANCEAMRDEIPFGLDREIEEELSLIKIALAALTAPLDDWKQRAEAAEAKLAEREKQEPAGKFAFEPLAERYHHIKHGEAQHMEPKLPLIKLFTCPTPAVSLAELVPPEAAQHSDPRNRNEFYHKMECEGWNSCRAAMLANLEKHK